MYYEVIKEIKNNCSNNQMRDIFFEEYEMDDPDVWIREQEPDADEIEREDLSNGGIRYRIWKSDLPLQYDLTPI